MILLPLLLAPAVMAAATWIERRLGPSAAGWVAALPIAFSVAVFAVTLDAGADAASAMALSAATHVPAQVAFAVAFAAALQRGGLLLGVVAGVAAYVLGSVLVADLPTVVVVTVVVVLLVVGPRLMPRVHLGPGSPGSWITTGFTCLAASLIVGAALLSSHYAGPHLAGAVAAFPTMCLTVTVACVSRAGRDAGARALAGLVRSLPCYATVCLVVALATPAGGLAAIPLGLLAGAAAAAATWRGMAVAKAALAR